MQDAASVLTDRFAEVLARLPADLDLDDLAMESKASSAGARWSMARPCYGSRLHAARRSFVAPDCGLGVDAGDRRTQQPRRQIPAGPGDGVSRRLGGTAACGETPRPRAALARPHIAPS